MDNSKTELFESMPIPKAVITLSVPSVISSLVMVIYSLADTFFVGMMNDPVQNAAVTLAAPLLLAFNAVNNLFGIGSSSMMSRALGRKDYDTVYRSSAFGFYASLICSLLFSLLYGVLQSPILVMLGANAETMQATAGYLFWTVLLGSAPSILNVVLAYLVRAEGSSLHASIGTMCCCLLNIVLDLVFVAGLHFGVEGAAIATSLSNLVSALLILTQLAKTKEGYRFRPKQTKIHRPTLTHILGIGVPAAVESSMYAFSNLLIQVPINNLGTDAVAAWSATSKVDGIYWSLIVSFGVAIMAFVGQNYGAGKYDRMKASVRVCMQIAMGTTIVLSVLLMIFAKYCFLLFTDNPQVIQYATQVVYYFAPFYFIWTVIEVLANALRGAGDALAPMVISVGGVCGLRILWVFLVVPHWPTLLGISICYPLSWVLTAILLILRYRRAKWQEKAERTLLQKEA